MSFIKNIAMVGAGGRSGSFMVAELLKTGKHNVTAITRHDSKSSFAAGVQTKKVDYESESTLVEALKGQDALIITMSTTAPRDQQSKLIKAATEAEVPWILPNEYGNDSAHPEQIRNPVGSNKAVFHKQIADSGKSSWIALVCCQWYEYSMSNRMYSIDIKNRKATIFDRGDVKTEASTFPQVGRAVAKLLSLPISGATPCLNDYKNNWIYINSFTISQNDMLASAQRVTGTKPSDWTVDYASAHEAVENGLSGFQKGDFLGAIRALYAANFVPGAGNQYSLTKGTANKALKLPEEDLDEFTKVAIERTPEF